MPAAKPAPDAPRRKPGRPEGTGFKPSPDQRNTVKASAGFGLREDQIAQLVINPQTGRPISPVTLRAHFRAELDSGHVVATAAVAQSLFKNATTATTAFPGGVPVAQIFWMKTRAGWREARPGDPPIGMPSQPTPAGAEAVPQDVLTLARRVAFALAMGARDAAAAPTPKPEKKATA